MGYGGRPRSFDKESALRAAMLLFWERGFEQTGVEDLTKVMRISTSSLYSSFGDKRQLYLAALDLYRSSEGSYTKTTLEGNCSALESFRKLFVTAAKELTRPDQPRGCMLALSMTTSSPGFEELQSEVNRRRSDSLEVFRKRLVHAKANEEFAPSVDVNTLASYLMNTLLGLSLQARAGAGKAQLLKIGEFALRSWPSRSEC